MWGNCRLEIIVKMEGTSLSTSNTSSTTTSYLSTEILWGHVFKPCVKFDKDESRYVVNHKLFNSTKEMTKWLEDLSFSYYDLSFNSSPSSLNDIRRMGFNRHSDSVTISPVTVHASIDGKDNMECRNQMICSDDEDSVSTNTDDGNDQNVDSLLASLQKFLRNQHKVKTNYNETSFWITNGYWDDEFLFPFPMKAKT